MKEGPPVVLLTGASGFIGTHLTPVLEQAGWLVRRALRKPHTANDVLIGSLGSRTDWADALTGVDAVVHLAARVHHPREEGAVELYRSINVDGTLHLARCAAVAGVRHLIFLSTILVNGRSTDGRGPFSERDNFTPRGVYGRSKAAAEASLKTIANENNMRITVIRPPLVYGAGAKGNFRALARAVRLGIPLPFDSIRNRRAFLSVENLNSFIAARLASEGREYEVFLVADREQVSTPEFIRRLARATGSTVRLWPLPVSILSPLVRLVSRDAHDSIIGSLELDISRAVSTGWQPPLTLDEGLHRAVSG
jgi:UDP-glucose 4-epimerase